MGVVRFGFCVFDIEREPDRGNLRLTHSQLAIRQLEGRSFCTLRKLVVQGRLCFCNE